MGLSIPTFDELYQAFRAEVEGRNSDLDDWNEGSNLDAVGGGGAVLADEVIRWAWDRFGTHLVDIASGSDLDTLLLDRFGLTRHAAAAAVGQVTFTRGGSTGTITIPAGTVREGVGTDGETVQVETDEAVDLIAGDSTCTVAATCTETGRAGNVAAGVITITPTPLPADPTLTVTNGARFAGGAAEETDDQFRDRARRYFGTLRKGTKDALEAGALEVPGVSYVTVNEDSILPADGGYVEVVIADQDGYGNSVLADLVETELVNWRSAGIQVQVTSATREETTLGLTLYVEQGADLATIRADARAAVLAYTDSISPGESLYLSRASHEAFTVSDDVKRSVVDDPASGADIAPSAAQNILRVPTTSLSIAVVEL